MKYFLKLFLIVIGAEIVLWLLSMALKLNSMPKPLHSLGSLLTVLLSLPLSLIDRSYPYWAMGNIGFSIFLMLSTLLIHTIFFFLLIKLFRAFKDIISH